MSLTESLSVELSNEGEKTRKILERLPADKFSWRPHPKSWTLGELAAHLTNILSWLPFTLDTESLDITAPNPAEKPTTPAEVLNIYDKNFAAAKAKLASTDDQQLMQTWTALAGDQPLFSMPKAAVLRSFVFNHLIHHRGQLSLYLRLCDIPVPAVYGPSADERV